MKKLLSIVLALLVALLPVMSLAEEAAVEEASNDWVFAAFDQGRKITTNVSFDTAIEEMAALKDLTLSLELQEDPGMFRITISNAGEVLDTITFAAMDETLYIMDALTGINAEFSEEEFYELLDGFIPDDNAEELVESIVEEGAEEDEGFEDYVGYDDVDLNFTTLDLTPLLTAMISLAGCVETVAVTETDNDDELESTEFPDAELENADLGSNVIITLTADDATVLVNALCETITKNAELDLFFGQYIDSFTTLQEQFIDRMTQDLCAVIGLDANGTPISAAITCTLSNDDETSNTYVVEASNDTTEDGITVVLSAWAVISDGVEETETVVVDLLNANLTATEDNGTLEVEIGTSKQNSTAFKFDFAKEETESTQTAKLTLSAEEYTDGTAAEKGSVVIDFAESTAEADATCDVQITLTDGEDQLTVNVDAATSDAETIELPEEIVRPAQMSDEEMSNWLIGILASLAGIFTAVEG